MNKLDYAEVGLYELRLLTKREESFNRAFLFM